MLRWRLAVLGVVALALAAARWKMTPAAGEASWAVLVGGFSFGHFLTLAMVGLYLAFALVYLTILPEGDARWKGAIMRTHGLDAGLDGQLVLCADLASVLTWRDLLNPGQIGVLAAGPGGLAFFGERGGRAFLHAHQLERGELEPCRLTFPFRTVACFSLDDGTKRRFLVMERRAVRENDALTQSLLLRLQPKS